MRSIPVQTGLSKNNDLAERLIFLGFCGLFFFIPISTSAGVIVGGLTLALWFISGKFIKDSSRYLKQKWIIPVGVLILLPWVGLLWTEDVSTGLGFAEKSYYWLYAFAVIGISITAYRMNALMKAYVAGVSFTSGLFLLQLAGVVPMRPPYSVGLLNRWAHISFSLLCTFGILVLSFYFKKAEKKKDKILCLLLMLLNFLALSMLSTDSGHLAFILLSPVIAYNLLNRRHLIKIIGLSVLISGALFLSPVTQGRLDDAISGTMEYGKSEHLTPVGGRYYMWTGAIKIYLENPVFGIGTGGYQSEMRRYREQKILPDKNASEDPIQPHNSFLYMAVSFGIPGVVALVWLFVVLLKSGWRNRESLSGFSLLAFTLVLIIGSLTDTQILQVHTGVLFSVFTGLRGVLDEVS